MEGNKYNRLAEVLKEKGWTQKRLADKLNASQQSVQKVCANKKQMSMERLFKVAGLLNVDVCDLLVRNELLSDEEE